MNPTQLEGKGDVRPATPSHKLESECVELSPDSEVKWQDWGPEKGTGGPMANNRNRWVDRR